MLAKLYRLEKFHHYTYGHAQVITDHKPLTSIATKPLSRAPKRLHEMLLRAQTYNYTITYGARKDIPAADALSRTPKSEASYAGREHVCKQCDSFSPVNPDSLKRSRGATLLDKLPIYIFSWEKWSSEGGLKIKQCSQRNIFHTLATEKRCRCKTEWSTAGN